MELLAATPAAHAHDKHEMPIGAQASTAAKRVHAAACETIRRHRARAADTVAQLEARMRACEADAAKLVHRWQIRERNDKLRELCRLGTEVQHALSRTPQLVVEEAAAVTLKKLARLEKQRRASLTAAAATATFTTPATTSPLTAPDGVETTGCLTHLDRRRRRTPRADRQPVDPDAVGGPSVIALREDMVVQSFLRLFQNCGGNDDDNEGSDEGKSNGNGEGNDEGNGDGNGDGNDEGNGEGNGEDVKGKLPCAAASAAAPDIHAQLYCLPDNVCASCGARTDMNETSCMRVCTACFREQSVEAPAVAGVQSKSDWARRQTYMVDHAHRLLGMTHNLPDERANIEAVRRELLRMDGGSASRKVTLDEVERAMVAVGLGKMVPNSKHFVTRELRNVPPPTPDQFQMFVAMFSCLNSKFVELRATGVIKRLNMTSYPRNAYRLVSMMSWGADYLPIMGEPATVSDTHEQLWRQICAHVPQFRQAVPPQAAHVPRVAPQKTTRQPRKRCKLEGGMYNSS